MPHRVRKTLRPAGRVLVIALSLAALWLAATRLTRTYHDGQEQRATTAASDGRAALAAGRTVAAVRAFRAAAVLQPDVPSHRLALAEALLTQQQWPEAERYLLDVLRVDAANGAANLALARAYRGQGRRPESEARYYQAIHGRWPGDAAAPRIESRLELIDFLAAAADRERARTELLQLASAFPGNLEVGLQAARTLLDQQFPGDAARLYEELLSRFPSEAPVLAGLAEAELVRHRYPQAAAAARRALALAPDDPATAARLTLATTVAGLDPNQPRLSARERATRTRRLLDLVRDRLGACQAALPAEAATVRAALGEPRARVITSETLDAEYALLESAARLVVAHCGSADLSQPLDLAFRAVAEGTVP